MCRHPCGPYRAAMKTHTVLALAAATVFGSGSLQAQRIENSRVALAINHEHPTSSSSASASRSAPSRIGRRGGNFGKRLMLGTLGMIGGAAAGYAYGDAHSGATCTSECYFGKDAEIAGLFIGWIGGAALGAALPSFGSACSVGTRTLRALGGSAVGLVAGGIAAMVPVAGIVGIIGAPFGAAFAQQECS